MDRSRLDDATANRTLQNVVELFIVPEIQRRHNAGAIPTLPSPLWAAQVILPGDGSEAVVRLNEEIRGGAALVVKPGVSTEAGAQITLQDIVAIERIELSEPEDLNAGHITVMWFGEYVFLAFDFRRNKEVAGKLAKAASEFFDLARYAKEEKKSWSGFVDNLYSTLELSIKAYLWTSAWGLDFRPKMHHVEIAQAFRRFPIGLNQMSSTNEVLEKLRTERKAARYLHKEIVADWSEGETWYDEVGQMLRRAEAQVQTMLPKTSQSP